MWNKFPHKPRTVDGIKFQSTTESHFYEYLTRELGFKAGVDFRMQVEYLLIEPFKFKGKQIRGTSYISDFTLKDGTIIDVKGKIVTDIFRIKNKLMKWHFNKEIIMVSESPKYYKNLTGEKWLLLENKNKIVRLHKANDDKWKTIKFKRTLKKILGGE
jgi:hypothetical protein